MLSKSRKLTTEEVANEYRRHPVTVRIDLNAGVLHGRQRVPGGRWLVDEACAEAWSNGDECEHMAASRKPLELRRIPA